MTDDLRKRLASLHLQYDWDNLFLPVEETYTTPTKQTTKTNKKTPKSLLASFSKQRDDLTKKFYKEFNERAFQSQLPTDLEIKWSKRMTKTAGFTKMMTRLLSDTPRVATIELSVKVIDNEQRLRETLLHEMCHVAAFLVDHQTKPPHGDCFWKWARRAERGMNHTLQITTCHSYEISKPFTFTCTNASCLKEYGRHSKKGIDITRQVCGICRSRLEYSGKKNHDGTPIKARTASGFSLFVKEHYNTVKRDEACGSHGEVMKALSAKYAAEKDKANVEAEYVI